MSAIFISHSSRDNEVAEEIRAWLEGEGHRCFLDFDPEGGIPSGSNWEQELYWRVRGCRAVVVLCSRRSMASKWCFMEITHARALGKRLFPVKIDDCDVDGVLTDLQVIDYTAGGRQGALAKRANEILEEEKVDAATAAHLRKAVLSLVRITDDGTFARRTAYVDELPKSTRPLLDAFVAGRLLVPGSDGERKTLEVAHETLFDAWDRLRNWLKESAEALRLRHEIEIAVTTRSPSTLNSAAFSVDGEPDCGRRPRSASPPKERCRRMVGCLRDGGDDSFEGCYREFRRSQAAGD